ELAPFLNGPDAHLGVRVAEFLESVARRGFFRWFTPQHRRGRRRGWRRKRNEVLLVRFLVESGGVGAAVGSTLYVRLIGAGDVASRGLLAAILDGKETDEEEHEDQGKETSSTGDKQH